jgi:putative tryptophan/tyrosine transport system substrate-binding protein
MARTPTVLVATLALGLLAAPLAVEAQPAGKVARIGMIMFGSPENAVAPAPFRQRLLELGYVEGQTAVLEMRYARGREEALPELLSELVRLRVDAIYATGDQVVLAAKRATSTIPIVMVACDALAAGLVDSLSHPGGNLTGVSCLSSEIGSKRLALLREAVPRVSRVGVVWNSGDPGKTTEWRNTEIAARALGMTPTSLEVRSPNDIDAVLTPTTRQRIDSLMVLGDALTIFSRRRITELVAKNGLPAVYGLREFVEAGGLMSYGPSNPAMFRHAADYVDKILKGAKPGDLPVEQPTTFDLIINLKTAKALGLTIPPSLLARADEVIQ